jgi:hypothetical protein
LPLFTELPLRDLLENSGQERAGTLQHLGPLLSKTL